MEMNLRDLDLDLNDVGNAMINCILHLNAAQKPYAENLFGRNKHFPPR